MVFEIVVMLFEEFVDWLQVEVVFVCFVVDFVGEVLFCDEGCGVCYVVCGIDFIGQIGLDFMYLVLCVLLVVGIMQVMCDDLKCWIVYIGDIKFEVVMFVYDWLFDVQLDQFVIYLEGLK